MTERDDAPPGPEDSATVAEFIASMKRLRLWSGLTYRQLEAKARANGDVLPFSTTATMLNRHTLPREPLVAAFTRACGLGSADVDRWLAVRRRLAVQAPEDVPPAPSPPRGRWTWLLVGVLAVIATATTVVLVSRSSERALPADGWYRLSPAHTADRGLCVGEGRERNRRTHRPLAVQRPCEGLVPDTFLEAVGPGVYLIKWNHPEHGWGCLSVDDASLEDETLLQPTTCTSAAHQRFLLEPVQTPVPDGFTVRPVHSGKCVGLLYGPADVDPGAELAQNPCSGRADQEFLVAPVEP